MENLKENWSKAFIGFGIVTVLSGIYLLFQGDFIIGVSGSMVGILLIYQNLLARKQKDEE